MNAQQTPKTKHCPSAKEILRNSLRSLPGYFASMAIGAASGALVGAIMGDVFGGMVVGIIASGASSTFHGRCSR